MPGKCGGWLERRGQGGRDSRKEASGLRQEDLQGRNIYREGTVFGKG